MALSIFSYVAGHLNIFFGEIKFKSFAHFLIELFVFCCWVVASSFLKDIFAGYRNLGWQSSFSAWNKLCTSYGLHGLWREICCHSNCLSVVGKVSFSTIFKIFLFLVSSNLMMIFLGMNLLGLSSLGFAQLLESVGLTFAKFEELLIISFSPFFSPFLFLYAFWESDDMNVRSFVIIPQVPVTLLFLNSISSVVQME